MDLETSRFYNNIIHFHRCDNEYESSVKLSTSNLELIDLLINYYVNNIRSLIPRFDNIENTILNVSNATKYLKENFDFNDVNIFTCEEDYNHFEKKISKVRKSKFENIIKQHIYNNFVTKASPFNIKISVAGERKEDSWTDFSYPSKCNEAGLFKPYFDHIYINAANSHVADLSYVHEIAHTQTETQNNSYHKLFNMETISMLMEMIYAYDSCSSRKLAGVLVESVGDLINYSEYINDNSIANKIYFFSKSCALELFSIYKLSNEKEKNIMKSFIQQVFDGKISVEYLLDYYNINFYSPKKNIIIRSLCEK